MTAHIYIKRQWFMSFQTLKAAREFVNDNKSSMTSVLIAWGVADAPRTYGAEEDLEMLGFTVKKAR